VPVDRFFHPRAGHSRKVAALSDLEFRVWWTYQMAADDFGVMRRAVVELQAANDALATRPRVTLKRALDRVVDIGLLVSFVHQGEPYVCQLNWQDFQKIRYPRESFNPIPGPDVLAKCSGGTAELFQKRFWKIPEIDPEHSGNAAERSRENAQLPRAGAREEAYGLRLTADGKRQTANGKRQTANGGNPQFEAFWAIYPRKVAKDAAWRAWQKRLPDAALTSRILAAVTAQQTWSTWTKDGGEFIPYPATWLNRGSWDDEPTVAQVSPVSAIGRQNAANAAVALDLMEQADAAKR
jgi:hypothetical protein